MFFIIFFINTLFCLFSRSLILRLSYSISLFLSLITFCNLSTGVSKLYFLLDEFLSVLLTFVGNILFIFYFNLFYNILVVKENDLIFTN